MRHSLSSVGTPWWKLSGAANRAAPLWGHEAGTGGRITSSQPALPPSRAPRPGSPGAFPRCRRLCRGARSRPPSRCHRPRGRSCPLPSGRPGAQTDRQTHTCPAAPRSRPAPPPRSAGRGSCRERVPPQRGGEGKEAEGAAAALRGAGAVRSRRLVRAARRERAGLRGPAAPRSGRQVRARPGPGERGGGDPGRRRVRNPRGEGEGGGGSERGKPPRDQRVRGGGGGSRAPFESAGPRWRLLRVRGGPASPPALRVRAPGAAAPGHVRGAVAAMLCLSRARARCARAGRRGQGRAGKAGRREVSRGRAAPTGAGRVRDGGGAGRAG